MQRILRLLAPFALLLAAIALVACGGDDKSSTGGTAVKSDNAEDILAQTFSGANGKKVKSGKIDLTATINASGAGTNLNGPIDIKLSGPFQSLGKGKVPKFDMALEFTGAGQNIKAGAVSTGDKGFINFNGQAYAVDDATFKQFADGYIQAQKNPQSSPTNLKSLGLNPQNWLKDAKVDGDSNVGGTDTVKVTGTVDVPKLLTDVNTFLSKAGSLGIPNAGTLPSKLTDAQVKQVEDAVKTSSVEIETGKDDSILRRMAFKLSVVDPQGSGSKADIDFDISLTDIGEDQSVQAPSNTKPLNDLLGSLGGLGGLGALGGSSSGSSGSSGSGTSSANADKYTQCVKDAGSDTSKLQDCSKFLTP